MRLYLASLASSLSCCGCGNTRPKELKSQGTKGQKKWFLQHGTVVEAPDLPTAQSMLMTEHPHSSFYANNLYEDVWEVRFTTEDLYVISKAETGYDAYLLAKHSLNQDIRSFCVVDVMG